MTELGNQRAVTHGVYIKTPKALRLRAQKVARLTRRMELVMPWLDPADKPATRAWAELEILGAYAFAELIQNGITNKEGEPRKLLEHFRQIRLAQLAYERELGMTPASRMNLRVGAFRAAHDRPEDGADAVDDAGVQELERRYIEGRADA